MMRRGLFIVSFTALTYVYQRYQITFRQTVALAFGWNQGCAVSRLIDDYLLNDYIGVLSVVTKLLSAE